MNKLEQLIQELCPHGVEYKKLGEVCKIKNGQDYKKLKQGDIPVYGSGGIMTYVDTSIYDKPSVLIPRKGSLKNIFYVENGFWNVDTIFYTEINSVYYVEKFFYYLIKQIDLEKFNFAGGVPSLTQSVLNKIILPIPPLEIQKEIVRILDTFTELEKELEKELEARKKQYEFYREQLLSFNESIPVITLKDVCMNISSGGTPLKNKKEFYNGDIPWLRTQEVKFNEIYKTENFITELAIKNSFAKWIPANCVIIAISGATAGRSAINKIPLTTNQHCCNLEINSDLALYKFVYYWVAYNYENIKNLGRGAREDLNVGIISKFKIPLPPLEEQERIVNILDRFDALCNDLTCGLPAEIEARKKQYAYYRDKLLTFKNIFDKNIV